MNKSIDILTIRMSFPLLSLVLLPNFSGYGIPIIKPENNKTIKVIDRDDCCTAFKNEMQKSNRYNFSSSGVTLLHCKNTFHVFPLQHKECSNASYIVNLTTYKYYVKK
jgi:hypothetical protein